MKLVLQIVHWIKKNWAIGIIIILVVIFAKPYLLERKVPFPSEYQVNFFPPWSYDQKNWGPYKNGAMPDIISQIYPWKKFTISAFQNGTIPFWNPNNFSGNPHVGNFQSAVFSPLNLLFFILPFIDAWSIIIFLQPLIAGLGMVLYLRAIQLDERAAVFGAISYMFCGFIVVWMAYGTLSLVVALLPFLLFCIETYKKSEKKRYLLFLSLGICFLFFSGHFQMGGYVLLFILFYLLWIGLITKSKKVTVALFIAVFFGIGLSLIQLIPTIQLYLVSVRSGIFIQSGGIPFVYLVNLFSPDFFGNPVTRNDWTGYYAEWASFIGIIPFYFSFFSISRKNDCRVYLFWSTVGIVLLLVVDSFVQPLIGSLKVPVFSTSNPSRLIFLGSFALSVLGAIGFHNYFSQSKNAMKHVLFSSVIPVGIFITIWVFLLFMIPFDSEKLQIAKRNMILPTALLFVSIFIVWIQKIRAFNKIHGIFPWVIIGLLLFDSMRFANKWMPFDTRDLVFPESKIVAEMKKHIGYGRVFGNFGAEVSSFYNLPILDGYDPLYIERYGEFVRAAFDGNYSQAERSVVKVPRKGKYTDRLLDITGVSLVFHPVADTNTTWAYPVWKDQKRYSLVYNDGVFQLFKNNYAVPRVSLFYDYIVMQDKRKILSTFYSDNFDYYHILILESNPRFSAQKQIGKKGKVDIQKYSPSEILISVDVDQNALVFLSDAYYDNWKVEINGKKGEIYRANYTFRAVEVEKGKSDIRFYYDLL